MAKGAVRKKNLAILLAMKEKPKEGEGLAPEDYHGTKPPEVQTMAAFLKAMKDDNPEEALACFESLFRHCEAGPHEEGPHEGDEEPPEAA